MEKSARRSTSVIFSLKRHRFDREIVAGIDIQPEKPHDLQSADAIEISQAPVSVCAAVMRRVSVTSAET